MATQRVESRTPPRSFEYAALVLAVGLVLGAIVSLTAFFLARYGPSGDSWSFRGNGALAAYSLLPAFLAGGWTAIVLRHRGRPWLALGIVAALVGLALAVLDASLLPFFGPSGDQSAGPVLLIALAAWSVIAPIGAMLLPAEAQPAPTSVGLSLAAALLWAVGLAAGIVLTGFAFPAGS